MKRGDRVRLISNRSRQGVITEIIDRAEGNTVLVFFAGGEEAYVNAEDLELVPSPTEILVRNPVSNRELAFRYLWIRARERLDDILYSLNASRTDFQPYQFKPVLKFLGSEHHRLYIADEVGLGKTIEAALILLEHCARVDTDTILVVCPAALIPKWQRELNRRFSLGFRPYSIQDIGQFLGGEQAIPAAGLRALCSLQSLRRESVVGLLENAPKSFDFVILDEAHNIKNSETASWELAEVLSRRCEAMIMLSATPLMLGRPDLFNQLRVLVPSVFNDFALFDELLLPNAYLNRARRHLNTPRKALEELRALEDTRMAQRFVGNEAYLRLRQRLATEETLTRAEQAEAIETLNELNPISPLFVRTRKREAQAQFPERRAVVLKVELTQLERACYEAIRQALAASARIRGSRAFGLSMMMPLRIAASCLPAMKEYFPAPGQGAAAEPGGQEELDPVGDSAEEWTESGFRQALVLAQTAAQQLLQDLGGADSKFKKLLDLLVDLRDRRDRPKILLFSFFKKTLSYLQERLSREGWTDMTERIDGDTSPWERDRRMQRFQRDPEARLLLSTEVGGEGVDLWAASVLINYDLPWNPMKVEQRIGRLDRYGQRSPIINVYNFSVPGTIDAVILERLYLRIGIFETYIGDLDVILGDEVASLSRALLDPTLTDEERGARLDQIALNIERRQRDLETLERGAQDLLGFDDLFLSDLEAIRQQHRYLTSDELSYLTVGLCDRLFPGKEIFARDGHGSYIWTLSPDRDVAALVERELPSDEVAIAFGLRCTGSTVRITFDAEKAQADPSLELISLQHPLLQALMRRFHRADQRRDPPISIVRVVRSGLEGEWCFLGYILERDGLIRRREFKRLVVRREDLAVVDDWATTERIFGALTQAQPAFRQREEELQWFKMAAEKATRHLTDFAAKERETHLKEEGERKRSREIIIRRETEIRVGRVETILEQILRAPSPDSRIVRLHEGRIRRLREEEERRLERLRQTPRPEIRFSLAIAGIAICE